MPDNEPAPVAPVAPAEPVAPVQPVVKLLWQGAARLLSPRIFKIRTPQGHGTGFLIGRYGTDNVLCAVATAYHVVQSSHDWGEPIKLIHADTGREILLRETERAIFTYASKDLAIILFNLPDGFNLPVDQIDMVPNGNSLAPGVDVGWYGFPAVRGDKLCFFHGYISCYLDQEGDYLVDGVAINGVSGGPVFFINAHTNAPMVVGVITAYIANRATGETLPGLSMSTSVAPYEETLTSLRNLGQATEAAKEQNAADAPVPNPDPLADANRAG